MIKRFGIKTLIVVMVGILVWASLGRNLEVIRERYVYKVIADIVKQYVYKKYGATLFIGRVKGNIINELIFEDLVIKDLKKAPADLQFSCRLVKFKYFLLQLPLGRFDINTESPRLIYKNILLPLKVFRKNNLIAINIDHYIFDFKQIEDVVPSAWHIDGKASIQGDVILKDSKSRFMNINLESQNLKVIYRQTVTVHGAARIVITGTFDAPQINGVARVKDLFFAGGLSAFSLFKNQRRKLDSEFLNRAVLNVNIKAIDATLASSQYWARLSTQLQLRKRPWHKMYLLGSIDILSGRYATFDNEFNLTSGRIFYWQENKSPQIDISAEAKIRRYKILAQMSGTTDSSQLVLTSKPQLKREEIISLILFGKKPAGLSPWQKQELSNGDFYNILVSNIFVGKAELELANSIGLDDLNFQFLAKSQNGSASAGSSLELGKYILGDSVYGVYSVKAHPVNATVSAVEQSAGAEWELSDNLILKGERNWQDSSVQRKPEDKVSLEFKWDF
jgi:hypothetical protein